MGLTRATPPSPPASKGGTRTARLRREIGTPSTAPPQQKPPLRSRGGWGGGIWVTLALTVLLMGCSGQMADQPSIHSQEDPLLPASGSIPLTPPRPWSMAALPPGGATASNPLPRTAAVLAVGAVRYRDYCSFCHGQGGKGDGPVGEVYAPRPRDLTDTHVRGMSDGLMFERITNGFSTMPSFRKRLSTEDRWAIIWYVRQLRKRAPFSGP